MWAWMATGLERGWVGVGVGSKGASSRVWVGVRRDGVSNRAGSGRVEMGSVRDGMAGKGVGAVASELLPTCTLLYTLPPGRRRQSRS